MKERLLLILVLSIVDAWFTLHAIHDGRATEANPLMNRVLMHHTWTFISVKMVLTSLGAMLLWLRRNHQLAARASWILAGGYCLLTVYHLIGWSL